MKTATKKVKNKKSSIDLTPMQQYTFQYLSSEYYAMTRVEAMVGEPYNEELRSSVSKLIEEKKELFTHEFNCVHGIVNGGSCAIRPESVVKDGDGLDLPEGILPQLSKDYLALVQNQQHRLDETKYSDKTITWLKTLTHYRLTHPDITASHNMGQVTYNLVQVLGDDLSDIANKVIKAWMEVNLPDDGTSPVMDDLEAKLHGYCFYTFQNVLMELLLCDTGEICRWMVGAKNKPEADSDFQETLQQIVFTAVQDYIVGSKINKERLTPLLETIFTQYLDIVKPNILN